MDKRTLTCIGCPLGCTVEVTTENGQILSVTGNTCKRGEDYARKEVTNPTRIVTTTSTGIRRASAGSPLQNRKRHPQRPDL